jgi:protein kinase A
MHNSVTQSSRSTSFAAPGDATGNSVDVPFFRESQAMIGQGPITPPISPGHCEDKQEPEPTNYLPGQVQHPIFAINTSTPVWQQPQVPVVAPQPKSPARPPARLLEDEAVHVERRGVIRLLDFEVKGALGLCPRLLKINTALLFI